MIHPSLFTDVKIVLSEFEFEKIESNAYEYYTNCKMKDCLICMNEFGIEDVVIKTCEEHIFHKHCIKKWLCEESNKCPICKKEIGNEKKFI
jgi:hypothetical protein